ncbi:hypothetical protein FRC12_024858 [Ceratobasidium sp. 428]|nr:hypothetical protein FRC12_024858 [Ceratobasidium sp. 428]
MGDPGKISRDVKGLVADFREELKLRDPWDREIDIQFKRIQRRYKELLFDFPFARQAHSVDQALWTDTSYALITRYRARIDPVRNSSANNKNVVENRKILQKFLAFLTAEGTFWSGIALRLVRAHGLHEANKALTALGIDVVEFENRESLNRHGVNAEPGRHGAETDPAPPSFPPPSPEHRSNKLLAVFRTLIFMGDLARYREQYGTHPNKSNNESGRRPRGGRRGRDKNNDVPPEKRYAKAEAFYLQARLLLPDYGNPFNQLAIVYSYQHDLFGAALNYYRALCVRRPFPTAKDNLMRTLGKCLEVDREMWRARRAKEEEGEKGKDKAPPENEGPGDLETKFKQDVVLLHALWAGKCRPPKLARHTHNVLASFASLTARRLLPSATLVHVLVLALGALWKLRMFRDGDKPGAKSKEKGKGREDTKSKGDASPETRIVAHILALCTALLELGAKEIEEGVREATELTSDPDDSPISERLAQRITGTFRRTLPALRIASKWVKSNVEYIQRHAAPASEPSTPAEDPVSSNPTRPDPASFWLAWARFSTQLSVAFPLDSLPEMTVTLEEDIDMKGFAPLKRGMSGEDQKGGEEVDAASVHPNEEQLMRIGDLIVDAKFIVNVLGCPISLVDGTYVFDSVQTGQVGGTRRAYHESGVEDLLDSEDEDGDEQEQQEDDRATVSTRTEDDPVRLAMDAVLSEDEDDQDEEEEEEILYPQKSGGKQYDTAISPPQGSALPAPGSHSVPSWPPPAPSFLSDSSPVYTSEPVAQPPPAPIPKPSGTTAQDLLDRVLSGTTGPGAPSFLSGPTRNASPSMRGPTPSFLRQNSALSSFDPAINNAFASMSPFPSQSPPFENPVPAFGQIQNPNFGQGSPFAQTPTFMRDQNSTFPTQPFSSQLSPFPSQRSPSTGGPPGAFAAGRKVSDPVVPYFPSHTRVASLSGATSIWTPAPQEAPHLSMPSRSGSMRANSMSAGMGALVPSGLPGASNVWAPQEGDGPRSSLGFGDLGRSRTFPARTEASHW